MEEIQIFSNPEFGKIRTVLIDGEPWFVGRDVALSLGYAKPQNAIKGNVDKDDARKQGILTNGGEQQMVIVNESGLYSLIFGSKLENAKKFKHWVTSEVLPTIRKTGTYSTGKEVHEASDCIRQSLREAANKAYQRRLGFCMGIVSMILEKEHGDVGSIMAVYSLLSDAGKQQAMNLMQQGETCHAE